MRGPLEVTLAAVPSKPCQECKYDDDDQEPELPAFTPARTRCWRRRAVFSRCCGRKRRPAKSWAKLTPKIVEALHENGFFGMWLPVAAWRQRAGAAPIPRGSGRTRLWRCLDKLGPSCGRGAAWRPLPRAPIWRPQRMLLFHRRASASTFSPVREGWPCPSAAPGISEAACERSTYIHTAAIVEETSELKKILISPSKSDADQTGM